jgi:lipid-binding SYLF domain-containing protein
MKLIAVVLIASFPSFASADWTADPSDKAQVKASAAVAAFRDSVPRTEPFFEKAYGYAIYPSITRVGFGFGGAYGKGIIVAGDAVIGRSKYWQFTSGIQAGAKNFSMIIFFRDKEALEYFQLGKTQFMGQAGIDVATFGAAGTPGYNDGVAVITMNRLGLMGEFTVSGAKFTYKPLEVSESP